LIAYPSGRKSFFVEYGSRGRRKVHTLGPFGVLTVEEARKRAQGVLAEVLKGEDPNVSVKEKQKAKELTFAAWTEQYLVRIAHRRRSTWDDKRFFKMAKKRFGTKPLISVTVDDIQKGFDTLTADGTPIQANRWLAAIRACLQEAWRQSKIPDNPAKKVRPNQENEPRDRVVSNDEMEKVIAAIQKEEPAIRAAFILLIETGARLSEVRRAEWLHFDLERGLWTIPSSHNKSNRKKLLPLNTVVLAELKGLEPSGRFLLPGTDPDKPRVDFKRPWERIKKRAELEGVAIHDFRRTFGLRIARQAGLHMASRLLGHSDISVTQKVYAPLDIEDRRKAVETSKTNWKKEDEDVKDNDHPTDAVVIPFCRDEGER
jgi:integrase